MRRRLAMLGAGAALLVLSGCFVMPPSSVTTAVGGLSIPWDVQWTPDGTMLYTQRAGTVEAIVGGQKRVLADPADVLATSEAGMLGLAVDPQFASNRFVYTCFASTISGGNDVRLVRWRVNAGFTGLTNRTDIVTGMPVNAGSQVGRHAGCRPRFGPDGALWVGTGDAATGTVPQNIRSLGGKVLRVDRNGVGVSPNPGVLFPASGFDPRIYTYGHRNVQGIAFRANGQAYSVEHGPGRDDEVNLLVAGGNYGWNPVSSSGGGYNEGVPMTDLVEFPNARRAVWSSGAPTIATSGATFVNGSQWAGWNGALVIGCLKGSRLFSITLSGDGTKVVASSTALTNQGRLRTTAVGPGGVLYVTTSNGGGDEILRIAPNPPS
jgi:glucose/arabinose dehydrogenase